MAIEQLQQLETLRRETIEKAIEIVGGKLRGCIRVEISLYTSDNLNKDEMKRLFFDEALKHGWEFRDEGHVVWCWNDDDSVIESNGNIILFLEW